MYRPGFAGAALLVVATLVTGGADGESLATCVAELAYSCQIEEVPEDAKIIDLWLPVPSDTEGQTVRRVAVVRPEGGAIAQEAAYGNRIYHTRFTAPFAPEQLGAELVFEIARTEIVVPEAKTLVSEEDRKVPQDLSVYLAANRLIPIDGPIDALAGQLKLAGEGPLRAARTIYDYLIEAMDYNWQADGAGKGDVRWVCENKTGDCTDYNSLFLALCRNQGIPADHAFGFPIRGERERGSIFSYHCWARFWVAGAGWIPVDPSEADKHPELRDYNFGSQSARLMAFSHGRDLILEPPQQGAPINYFIHPYVEIDGRPHEAVRYRVRYRLLPGGG